MPAADRESRLDEALGSYYAELSAGRPVECREFLARHPELAADLERFFADDDTLAQLLSPLRPTHASPPAAGTSLGDYDLLEVIGVGGTGVVYRARQRSLNRLVALKMVRGGGLASAEDLRRFRAEAETIAALDHPNIVPVYEVGEHAGQLFFTMKLLEGGDLGRWLAGPPRDAGRPIEVLAEVARAVHYAHQRGVLHRDLKPSNVLLDADGRPQVADFGLAKWLTTEAGLTATGALVGTPAYMAPEQAAPDVRGAVTTAADVYGLGAILYVMLTGQAPYRGETPLEVVTRVRERDPEPPARLNPAADRDLETVCLKCLHKDPARRYGSAEALAEDLERWLRGEPVAARRAGRPERLWRWCRRNPLVAALGSALAALLVLTVTALTAGVVLLARETADKETQRADAARQKDVADEERRGAVAKSRALQDQVYAADMDRAYRLTATTQGDHLGRLLARYVPGEGEDDLRGFEWRYLRWLQGGGAACRNVLRGHLGEVYAVAFSPDGQALASAGYDGIIRLWDVPTGKVRSVLVGHWGKVGGIAFSPDGLSLASAGDDRQVKLWDLAGGRARATLRGHTDHAFCVAFSPDGSLVASGARDGTVYLWDATRGEPRCHWTAHREDVLTVAFAPDGQTLATGGDADVKVWGLRPGGGAPDLRALFPGHYKTPYCVTFSHDGAALASASGAGMIRLFDLATSQERGRGWDAGLGGHVAGLAFSPDDRLLASAGYDAQVALWELPGGKLRRVLRGHTDRARAVAFTPDGRTLASGSRDGTVRLWDMTTPGDCWAVPDLETPVTFLAFSREGRTLAAETELGTMTWWEVEAGPRMTRQSRAPLAARVADFLPGGSPVVLEEPGRGLRVWDPLNGNEQRIPIGVPVRDPLAVALGPDGQSLVMADERGGLVAFDWESGRRPALGEGLTRWSCVRFTPDGSRLVACHFGEQASMFEVATGQAELRLKVPGGASTVAWSAGGEWLAGSGEDPAIRLWDGRTGQERFPLLGHRLGHNALAFTPDGKTLASAGRDGQVKLWHVKTGRELLTLQDDPGEEARGAAFSADGCVLAVGGRSRDGKGFVRFWYGPLGQFQKK